MLAECQEKLRKLTCLENRLDSLETKMKGKVMVNEKTWTNLLSRVTLLETEMLLSKKVFSFHNIFGISQIQLSISLINFCVSFRMINERVIR